MAQVYLMRGENDAAIKVYQDNIAAQRCAVAPELMAMPYLRRTILSYQPYAPEPGSELPVHRHENAEAYTNLGNAYFVAERLVEAEAAYRRALALEPGYEHARKNLGVTYNKAQAAGRLKTVPPGLAASSDPRLFFTGYEVLSAKK